MVTPLMGDATIIQASDGMFTVPPFQRYRMGFLLKVQGTKTCAETQVAQSFEFSGGCQRHPWPSFLYTELVDET